MTKEVKKESATNETKNFMDSLKSNESVKTTLLVALKNTTNLMANIMPKLANSIKSLIIEFNAKNKTNTKTSDNDLIQVKALREHCYSLVDYDRKNNPNSAFEMVVTRSIRLAIMSVDYSNEFNLDDKTNKIFVMSKVATPFIVEKLEGQKAGTKKKPNTSEELVEVNTGIIDRVYKIKYPTKIAVRKPKTKDAKTELNFKDISREFKKYLTKSIQYAQKKDVQFFDFIDDSVVNEIKAIKSLLDNGYNIISQFNSQYQVDIDGEQVEKRVA